MPTRRETLLAMGALPFSGGAMAETFTGFESNLAGDVASAPEADRELTLRLSDDLATQEWKYAGQSYRQRSEEIVAFENERIRVTLVNDTTAPQQVAVNKRVYHIGSDASTVIEFQFDSLQPRVLRIPATGRVRRMTVRPSFQSHAAV